MKNSRSRRSVLHALWSLGAGVIVVMGCATDSAPPTGEAPSPGGLVSLGREAREAPPANAPSGFEEKRALKARDLVPPEILKSEHHTVDDMVRTDGFTNTYTISSKFGTFVAHGDAMLPVRVHEIEILAVLEDLSKSTGYLGGVADAVTRSPRGAWDFVKDPVDTTAGIPKGGYRWYSRVREMVDGERGELEDSVSEELVGFSQAKRNWAYHMKVDAYTSNKLLQEELNKFSWASIAGNYTVMIATFPISGPASLAMTITSTAKVMYLILRDSSPEDLRKINREKLEKMQIEEAVIEKFLEHPWYSPRHETILVEALAALEGVENRGEFLKVAVEAGSEEEAFFFQRMAEMMRGYHESVSPGRAIVVVNHIPMLYTGDGRLALTLLLDYLWWSPQALVVSDAVAKFRPTDREVRQLELWASGRLSSRARQELQTRGWQVEEQASERLTYWQEGEGKTFIYQEEKNE